MRYNYGRRSAKKGSSDANSFWLSFSDLMSGLLLVFVLIMFYSVYQYFDMLEVKTAELDRQSEILTQREAELDEKNEQLGTADEELSAANEQIAAREAELDAANEELAARQAELDKANGELAARQEELDKANEQLATRQGELDTARAQLDEQQQVVAQQQELLDAQQTQLDEIVGVRKRIITSLADALSGASISATVDPTTGAITLDASVLFARSESELTPAGRRMIDKFLPIYLDVLLSDEYRDNISEIIIEGHTDSVGSYMSNLELSQNRALAVARYVLSDEYSAIPEDMKEYLRGIVTANGRSESNLVYDENGNEDAAASRRVEFKFRLQDEQMIADIAQLLQDFDEDESAAPTAAPQTIQQPSGEEE